VQVDFRVSLNHVNASVAPEVKLCVCMQREALQDSSFSEKVSSTWERHWPRFSRASQQSCPRLALSTQTTERNTVLFSALAQGLYSFLLDILRVFRIYPVNLSPPLCKDITKTTKSNDTAISTW